jgi:hypothetical protein
MSLLDTLTTVAIALVVAVVVSLLTYLLTEKSARRALRRAKRFKMKLRAYTDLLTALGCEIVFLANMARIWHDFPTEKAIISVKVDSPIRGLNQLAIARFKEGPALSGGAMDWSALGVRTSERIVPENESEHATKPPNSSRTVDLTI